MKTQIRTMTFEQAWRQQYNWATDALRNARQPGFRYHAAVALHDGQALRERLHRWQENLTEAIEWVRYLTALYGAVQFTRLNETSPKPQNGWTTIQDFSYDLFFGSMDFNPETQDRGRTLVSQWREDKILKLDDHAALVALMDAHGKWPHQ